MRRMMRRAAFFIFVMLFIPLAFLGASGTTERGGAIAEPVQAEASKPAETVQTGSGEAKKPVRIISTGKGFSLVLNTLYMFPEAYDSLAVIAKSSQAGGHFTAYLDPGFAEKALIPMEAGAEEVASYKPDWVVLKSYLTASLGAQLEALGIKVLYVDLETPAQYTRDIEALGKIFGNPARAEELVRYFEEKRESITSRTAALPAARKPGAVFVYYTAKGGTNAFNVPPADWMQTLLFDWAGADPVWKDLPLAKGWTEVGFEQLAAWNPEYIFLVSYHMPVNEAKNVLLNDSKWKNLPAVKNGKLFAFPGDFLSWDQPDPRWIIGLYWLAGKLHPELVPQEEVEREVKNFFTFAWNISGEAVERDILPKITGDYR